MDGWMDGWRLAFDSRFVWVFVGGGRARSFMVERRGMMMMTMMKTLVKVCRRKTGGGDVCVGRKCYNIVVEVVPSTGSGDCVRSPIDNFFLLTLTMVGLEEGRKEGDGFLGERLR